MQDDARAYVLAETARSRTPQRAISASTSKCGTCSRSRLPISVFAINLCRRSSPSVFRYRSLPSMLFVIGRRERQCQPAKAIDRTPIRLQNRKRERPSRRRRRTERKTTTSSLSRFHVNRIHCRSSAVPCCHPFRPSYCAQRHCCTVCARGYVRHRNTSLFRGVEYVNVNTLIEINQLQSMIHSRYMPFLHTYAQIRSRISLHPHISARHVRMPSSCERKDHPITYNTVTINDQYRSTD